MKYSRLFIVSLILFTLAIGMALTTHSSDSEFSRKLDVLNAQARPDVDITKLVRTYIRPGMPLSNVTSFLTQNGFTLKKRKDSDSYLAVKKSGWIFRSYETIVIVEFKNGMLVSCYGHTVLYSV